MKKIVELVFLSIIIVLVMSSCGMGKHTHSFGEWTVTKEATCTESGEQERTCSCGEKQIQTVAAVGHSFGEWTIVNKPTCYEDGLQERICKCGEKEQSIVPTQGHTVVIDESIPASCTSTGLTEGCHCVICNEIIVKQEIVEKTEHTIVTIEAKPANCTEGALGEGQKCSVCGTILVEQAVTGSPLGHDYGDSQITKSADCEHDGESESKCKRCGDKQKTPIAALGHFWKDATCTTLKTCTVCGKTEGDYAAHQYSKKDTESATCTKNGKAIYTCKVCDRSYEEDIPATGHNWIAATCMSPQKCSVCGSTSGEALGHTTDDGICSRCNELIVGPYRQAINEEEERYQQLLSNWKEANYVLEAEYDVLYSTCSSLGIYSLQSEAYYINRISSIEAALQNKYAQLSGYQRNGNYSAAARVQREIESLRSELSNCYSCQMLARQKNDLDNRKTALEIEKAQIETEHKINLDTIEKQFKG